MLACPTSHKLKWNCAWKIGLAGKRQKKITSENIREMTVQKRKTSRSLNEVDRKFSSFSLSRRSFEERRLSLSTSDNVNVERCTHLYREEDDEVTSQQYTTEIRRILLLSLLWALSLTVKLSTSTREAENKIIRFIWNQLMSPLSKARTGLGGHVSPSDLFVDFLMTVIR